MAFQALLELSNSWAIDGIGRQDSGLESPAIKARLVAVEALADDLATANDD